MQKEYDYIIIGAGLCGLVLARDLSKNNKRILVLERGGFLNKLGAIRHAFGFYDQHGLAQSKQGVLIYRAFGVGGTSVGSCGNAVELPKETYQKIGINLQEELPNAKKESCVRENGLVIGRASARIMEVANKLGYNMKPMPKFSITGRCLSCGDCPLGCRHNIKWTAKECWKETNKDKLDLLTGFSVKKIIAANGKAAAVEGYRGFRKQRFLGDKIILSAGGLGTPVILQNSGLKAGDNLFVDLFNMTYGLSREFNQKNELTMSIVCDKFHRSEGFILSPFIDNFVTFSSSVAPLDILKAFRLNQLMGIMNKINDDNVGKVYRDGRIDKAPTQNDLMKLRKGSDIAKEILINCGVKPKSIFIAKPRGAHPGATAAVGKVVNSNLETQMKNLYVCDASVLPFAPGIPPMLTLIALSKWFAKNIANK